MLGIGYELVYGLAQHIIGIGYGVVVGVYDLGHGAVFDVPAFA